MDRQIRFVVGFLFLIAITMISVGAIYHGETQTTEIRYNEPLMFDADAYALHEPIYIDSNADFSSQGWPGNGTSVNPYIIEGLSFNTYVVSISIADTTAYFEVRDCLIFCNSLSSVPGIHFENVVHAVVKDCIIQDHSDGIKIGDSSSCNLTFNTLVGNSYDGLHLTNSNNCTLVNNTASRNNYDGFFLTDSDNCVLSNNTITSNDYEGITLSSSSRCTLRNNTLLGSGIHFSGSLPSNWIHDVSGNTINNRPAGYFVNLDNTSVDCSQYSQVILVNCTATTVKNGVFTNTSIGVEAAFCVNCTLIHNTVSNNSRIGALVEHSNNCNLIDNVAYGNREGFCLFSLVNCTLMNNAASSNDYGFILEGAYDCTLVNNIGSNNSYYGFNLRFSEDCNITDNIASNNTHHGFYLENIENFTFMNNTASNNSYYGLLLQFSNSCTLMNNTASSNNYGLYLDSTDNCTLTNNTVTNNQRYGVYLDSDSEYNILYMNRLGGNGESNARDDGDFNLWDDGASSGNYWSDYSGTGTYEIPGYAGSADNYPFLWGTTTTTTTTTTATGDMTMILVLSIVGITIVVIAAVAFIQKRR